MVLLRWVDEATSRNSTDPGPSTPKRKLVKVDTFHSYVRPTWRPQLTEFCINLTGISQVR